MQSLRSDDKQGESTRQLRNVWKSNMRAVSEDLRPMFANLLYASRQRARYLDSRNAENDETVREV